MRKIEELKAKLNARLEENKHVLDEEIVRISQELDYYLVKEQRKRLVNLNLISIC